MGDIHKAAEFLNNMDDSSKEEKLAELKKQNGERLAQRIKRSVKDKAGNQYELEDSEPTEDERKSRNERRRELRKDDVIGPPKKRK